MSAILNSRAGGNAALFSRDTSNNLLGLYTPNGDIQRIKKPFQTPGGIFCDWMNNGSLALTSANGGGEAVAIDSSVIIDGQAAVKCTFSNVTSVNPGSSLTYIAEFTLTNAISLAAFKTIQVPIIITSSESLNGGVGSTGTPFQVWLVSSAGKTYRMQCMFDGQPAKKLQVYSFSRYTTNGSYVPANGTFTFGNGATALSELDGTEYITKIRLVQGHTNNSTTGANASTYPVWVGPIRADARSVGRVCFVFDGEYNSQYTILKALLDNWGIKSSLAITNADIGQAGRMTLAQINQMYNEGHECIHHTYNSANTGGYSNATQWPTSQTIAADLKAQWDYFKQQGWVRGIGKCVAGFTETFTSTVTAARQALVLAGLQAGGAEFWRKSTNFYTQQMSLGNKGTVPFMLRGAIQVTNTNTPQDIMNCIDQAEANGELCIVTGHRAVDDGTTPGTLEMTTSNWKTVIDYAGQRQQAGGIICAPLGETFDQCFK